MTENKQLPLPVVLWLCGWKPNETNFKYSMKLGSYWIDSLDGFDHGPADDRECFWATARSMEQQEWAESAMADPGIELEDMQGKEFEIRSHLNGPGGLSNFGSWRGQTPWDCLVAMVSEIYRSGVCK